MISILILLVFGPLVFISLLLLLVWKEARQWVKDKFLWAWGKSSGTATTLFAVSAGLAAIDLVCWKVGFEHWALRWQHLGAFLTVQTAFVFAVSISLINGKWPRISATTLGIIAITGWFYIPYRATGANQPPSSSPAISEDSITRVTVRKGEVFEISRLKSAGFDDVAMFFRVKGEQAWRHRGVGEKFNLPESSDLIELKSDETDFTVKIWK